MDRMIYTAMTGANAAQQRQQVLANNLANASTPGFRAELSTFRAVPIRGDGASTRVFALEATAGHSEAPGAVQQTGGGSLSVQAGGRISVLPGDTTLTRLALGLDDKAILAIIDGHDTTKAARSAEDAIVKDADKLWRFGVTGVSVACDWFKMTPRQYADRLGHQVAQLETEAGRDWAAQELRATRVALKLNVI